MGMRIFLGAILLLLVLLLLIVPFGTDEIGEVEIAVWEDTADGGLADEGEWVTTILNFFWGNISAAEAAEQLLP